MHGLMNLDKIVLLSTVDSTLHRCVTESIDCRQTRWGYKDMKSSSTTSFPSFVAQQIEIYFADK